jgi:hypothetical protein
LDICKCRSCAIRNNNYYCYLMDFMFVPLLTRLLTLHVHNLWKHLITWNMVENLFKLVENYRHIHVWRILGHEVPVILFQCRVHYRDYVWWICPTISGNLILSYNNCNFLCVFLTESSSFKWNQKYLSMVLTSTCEKAIVYY